MTVDVADGSPSKGRIPPPQGGASYYVTGGTLSWDAKSYVARQADHDLKAALEAGEYAYVLDTRQMGKSSLMVRTAQHLRQNGFTLAVLDLTALGHNLSAEQWYEGLLLLLAEQIPALEDDLEDFWQEKSALGPMQRFFEALGQVVLPACPKGLVLFVDEIDATRSLPFSADEFFGGIRQCYHKRLQDTDYARLCFCLLGVATPSDLVRDTRLSPFNIGKRIALRDFTRAEAEPLARGMGNRGDALLDRVLYWTGGHPYLTQRLCQAVAEAGEESTNPTTATTLVDSVCGSLFLSVRARESDDNLAFVRNRLLRSELDTTALLELYGRVRAGKQVRDDAANALCSVLRLSGIVTVDVRGFLQVRNRIYANVFDKQWLRDSLPNAELQRQRLAVRRGRFQVGAIAGVVVALLSVLLVRTQQAERQARRESERANRIAYIANMNLAQRELSTGTVNRIVEIMEDSKNNPERGFEWSYLNRLCHLEMVTLDHPGDPAIRAVAGLQDGHHLLVIRADGSARIEDSTPSSSPSAERTICKGKESAFSAAISPNGKRFVISEIGGTAALYDAETGSQTAGLIGHKGAINDLAFSPDGGSIATGGDDTTVRIWNTKSGKQRYLLTGHTYRINAVAFSPDGKLVASGSQDHTVRLWEASSGKLIRTWKAHDLPVNDLAFSPDGKSLVTGGEDGHTCIWELKTTHKQGDYLFNGRPISAVRFAPEGRRLICASEDGVVRVLPWGGRMSLEAFDLKGHVGRVTNLCFLSAGTRLVTSGRDGMVKIWDALHRRDDLPLPNAHVKQVRAIAFSTNGDRLITGGDDAKAYLWNARTGKRLLSLKGHQGPILTASFSLDGKQIATGSADKVARLWDATTGRLIAEVEGHTDFVTVVAFSPDGKTLATGSRDTTIRCFDLKTGRPRFPPIHQNGAVTALAFADDGLLFSGDDEGQVRCYEADNGRFHHRVAGVGTGDGHAPTALCVSLCPRGAQSAVADDTGIVHLWNTERGKEEALCKGHNGPVMAMSLGPDGRRIVTGGQDGTVRVWNTAIGREVLTLQTPNGTSASAVTFSPDGHRLAVGDVNGNVLIWN